MGKNRPYLTVTVPAITLTCPITTMLFVDQFYGSKNACDPVEYTLKGAGIEPAGLTFAQTQRHAAAAAHDMC